MNAQFQYKNITVNKRCGYEILDTVPKLNHIGITSWSVRLSPSCCTMKATWLLLIFVFSFVMQMTAQRVVCPSSQIIFFGRCLTHEIITGITEYGPCPYIAHYNTTTLYNLFYIQMPHNASLFTKYMCGPLNREGTLCGKCSGGYGIALYSYL